MESGHDELLNGDALISAQPAWQQLLLHYRTAAERSADSANPTPVVRGLPRLEALGDMDRDALANAHGQLIAQGWLEVQWNDANAGLVYQVTSEGRRLLSRAAAATVTQVDAA